MQHHSIEVATEMLRRGLYVAELDRPWTETPFLFQGFEIASDEELETLRQWCRHVVVDAERSRGAALAALQRDLARSASTARRGAGTRPPAAADAANAFGEARFPDHTHFRALVRAAHRGRAQARRVVDAVMRDVRLGEIVCTGEARAAVEELVGVVTANASAALWLTNLKDRDEYTSIHCINVCIFALAFGRHLGFDRDQLVALGEGALLHDVGKTYTPPEILNKVGPLMPEEFEVIKRHPQDGYEAVAATGRVPQAALEVIRLHHERRDGGGYPLGLAGDRIPQHVLVAGIADAYDAMTSDRPYRDARSPDQALQQLYTERTDSFGSELVEEWIRCLGIFPVGSVVQLDNGAVGLVVATRPDARLQPTVLLLQTPSGEAYDKRLLVNLAGGSDGDGQGARIGGQRIARALAPGEAGVDVGTIATTEFGLEAG